MMQLSSQPQVWLTCHSALQPTRAHEVCVPTVVVLAGRVVVVVVVVVVALVVDVVIDVGVAVDPVLVVVRAAS